MFRLLLFLSLIFLANTAWAKEKIAYSHLTNDVWQIWVMDPDGQNKRQVTFSAFDKRDPAWITGENKVTFRTSNSQMFIADLDGKNEEQILKKFGVVTNPNYTKISNEIVFIRFDPRGKDKADIWVSDAAGESSKLLTKYRIGRYNPRFSPDGKKIVFVQADQGAKAYHIWMMNSDGSDPRQLTSGYGIDTHPDMSPDQKVITFSSNRTGNNFEIFNFDLRTSAIKQLTRFPGLDTQSRFSPDGKKIVFVSDRSGNQQIWVMKSDGSDPIPLTHEDTESIDPVWGNVD